MWRARHGRLVQESNRKILGALFYGHYTHHLSAGRYCAVPVWHVDHGCRPRKAGRRQDAGHIAETDFVHHQGRHFRHPHHRRHPVVGRYGRHLRRPRQLRHHDPYAVGRRYHGCKHWYYGHRSAHPHGGYFGRQPHPDPHPAQDVCAGGGVYRLHFLCVHPQREEKEHRPDHAGLRHPVHGHEPDGHRCVSPA